MEAHILSILRDGKPLDSLGADCAGEALFEVMAALCKVAQALSQPRWAPLRARAIARALAIEPRLRACALQDGAASRRRIAESAVALRSVTRHSAPLPTPRASGRLNVKRGRV